MSNESSQSLDSPTNEAVMARLLELENRTGYRMQQCNGQRRYWNPNWTGPLPPRGSEVFVGKIPRDLFEDEIVPVFEKIGRIYELRLMMDFSGYNRGYAFVTFSSKEDGLRAIELLDNFEIRPGLKIGVCRSVDNCKLFVGSIPKDKSREEIKHAMSDITEDVTDVIVYPGTNPGELNRGFAFVEYASHRAAAMARRKLIPGRITLFGYEVAVDWADPESDIKDDVVSPVKNVYVRNLKLNTSEFTVWSAFNSTRPGSIEKVKKMSDRDFAFVYFHKREDALNAVKVMNGKFIDGQEIYVSLAKSNVPVKRSLGLAKMPGDCSASGSFAGGDPSFNSNMLMNQTPVCMNPNSSNNNMVNPNRFANYARPNVNNGAPMCTLRTFPNGNMPPSTVTASNDRSRQPTDPFMSGMTSDMFGASNLWNKSVPRCPPKRKLRPAVTMDHIAKIKCPVTLLSELCARLDWASAPPYYTLFLDDEMGPFKCRYVYQVSFASNTYTPPISSDTIEEAKRVAAQYVIDQIAPWLKCKLDTLVARPPTTTSMEVAADNDSILTSFPQLSSLFSSVANSKPNEMDMDAKMHGDTLTSTANLDNASTMSSFGWSTANRNYSDFMKLSH